MNMKSDVKPGNDPKDTLETVGDATMISWSVFTSLEELRQAPMATDSVEPVKSPEDAAPAPAGDGTQAKGEGEGEGLQSALGQYTEWLRSFNR